MWKHNLQTWWSKKRSLHGWTYKFCGEGKEIKIIELLKCLYGLKQALTTWYEKMILTSKIMVPSSHSDDDHNLHYLRSNDKFDFVCWLMFIGNHEHKMNYWIGTIEV